MKNNTLDNVIEVNFKNNSKSKRVNPNLFDIPVAGLYYAYKDMKQCGLTQGERIFGTTMLALYQMPLIPISYVAIKTLIEYLK